MKNKIISLTLQPQIVFKSKIWKFKFDIVNYNLKSCTQREKSQGSNFKVEKGRTLYTHRLEGDVNAALVFDKVLLVDNGGTVSVGVPTVSGASVKATILEHLKGEKVIVFKKKRRKGYVKKNGHRQYLTKIQIDEIAG